MSFFEKTCEDFGEFKISSICLNRLDQNGCRHWILHNNGKVDQLDRTLILQLLQTNNCKVPSHYNNENEKEQKERCVIS